MYIKKLHLTNKRDMHLNMVFTASPEKKYLAIVDFHMRVKARLAKDSEGT